MITSLSLWVSRVRRIFALSAVVLMVVCAFASQMGALVLFAVAVGAAIWQPDPPRRLARARRTGVRR